MSDLFKDSTTTTVTTTMQTSENPQVLFQPTSLNEESVLPDLDALALDFKQSNDWAIPEAYLCLIISAAFSDGEIAPEEKQEIAALVMRSRTMKRLSPGDLANANKVVNERLQTRQNGLEEACQALPVDMRLSVFAHCVDIVLADGELRQAEADFLNRITAMLSLDGNEAKMMLSSVMIKNRY